MYKKRLTRSHFRKCRVDAPAGDAASITREKEQRSNHSNRGTCASFGNPWKGIYRFSIANVTHRLFTSWHSSLASIGRFRAFARGFASFIWKSNHDCCVSLFERKQHCRVQSQQRKTHAEDYRLIGEAYDKSGCPKAVHSEL